VVIPTLAADAALAACLQALWKQSTSDWEVIIVDNSGQGHVEARLPAAERPQNLRIIQNAINVGFGAACNQGFLASRAPYAAVLNDDTEVHPEWIEALLGAIERRPDVGMCASQVRLHPLGKLDSAGMLICGDGSSRQRGHLADPEEFACPQEILFPSGSAALYRRAMLDEIGGFDEDFFLYCEDTDLGLRARWAGWKCLYVPEAIVEHRYSHSSGRISPLKAYYVERNRLSVAIKNFPLRALWKAPFVALARYFWHLISIVRGSGAAAEYAAHTNGLELVWFVLKAHLALLGNLPSLLARRRAIQRTARISAPEFTALLVEHAISARQVAAL
jgi:GT2 family glycosyltransferase